MPPAYLSVDTRPIEGVLCAHGPYSCSAPEGVAMAEKMLRHSDVCYSDRDRSNSRASNMPSITTTFMSFNCVDHTCCFANNNNINNNINII